jgi:DNA-binding NarL/FixJ family response regulator
VGRRRNPVCPASGTFPPGERAFVARALPVVRAELGEETFTMSWAVGRTMTPEQALAAVGRIALSIQPPAQATRSARMEHQQLPSSHDLTGREVLCPVARGLTDAQIAEALVISPRTVNAHLRSIYTKLNITSRNAATYFAVEHDLM